MLTRLTISNFRCFRELDVPLKPLTVLIGPNDTGKSTFVAAAELLSGQGTDLTALDFFQSTADSLLVTAVSEEGAESSVAATIPPAGKRSIAKVSSRLNVQRFQIPVDGIETSSEVYDGFLLPRLSLGNDGRHVAAYLDELLRTELDRFLKLRDDMRRLIPGFTNIKVQAPKPGDRTIDFEIDNNLRLPASRASAGVRLLLFFLCLVHHPEPPDVILIEEPETGIHPRRLAEVIQLLRLVTHEQHSGHAAQVILTTHSPYLLDCVDPELDQVLVFQRLPDGSRTAMPIDAARIKEHFDGFLLGEVWFNEEEAGLIARGAE